MKIIFISLFIILIGISKLNAQSASTKIQIDKGFPRYGYRYDELNIGVKEVALILKKNEQAYNLIKPAKLNSAIGNSFMFVGVSMIIVPLGEMIKAGRSFKQYGVFAGIGAGIIGVSLPLLNKANKQAKKAIDLYNSGLTSNSNKMDKPEIYFGSTNNGIGLTMRF